MTLRKAVMSVILAASPMIAVADGEIQLVENMGHLQYFTHKMSLAIDAGNQPLADFYAHELEEYLEDTQKVESYHDKPIGKLVKAMLVPAFENVEKDIKAGKLKQASGKVDAMINACNACHSATGYNFIAIERRTDNPFMQKFDSATNKPAEK